MEGLGPKIVLSRVVTHFLTTNKNQSIFVSFMFATARSFGTYIDHSGFGGRFAVQTTAESSSQKAAVVLHLNERYGG